MLRASRVVVSASVASAVLAIAGEALAQSASDRASRAFNLQLFEPSPSARALLTLDLPTVSPHLAVTAALWSNYASVSLRGPDAGRPIVRDVVQTEAHLAVGFFQLFEVGLAMPLIHQSVASFGGTCSTPNGSCPTVRDDARGVTAQGDLRAYVKIPILRGRTGLALRLGASFPTGDDSAYAGAAYWSFAPSLALARSFGGLTLAANLGLRLNEAHASNFVSINDELSAGLGVRYDFTRHFGLIAEGVVRVPFDAPEAGYLLNGTLVRVDGGVPAELFAAATVRFATRFTALLGAGRGLTEAYGTSGLRVFAGLRFSYEPRPCTTGPEDLDGFEDNDFCADPDNDRDGVSDDEDRCPNDAEDADGFLDGDGCADPDNDGDGVPDDDDRCPLDPEDHDRYQNEDGCPEPDNDRDGIRDVVDACPDEGEDVDNYQDEDGCPEPGPDALVVTRTDSRLLVSQRIYFDYDSDTIRDVSFPILDEVAAAIRRNPDITRLRVEGHTDQAGTPEYNLDLSFRRARAVVEYLSAHGVSEPRLEYQGYGQSRPVVAAGTPDGEALNRRVEFTILGQSASAPATPSATPPPPPRHHRRH